VTQVDAAYFANALWADGRRPDAARIAYAKKRAGEFGVKWADVEALKPTPTVPAHD
jgi:hypothetical protein